MVVGDLRSKALSCNQINLIKEKTTQKQRNEARTLYGLKEHFNPTFSLNVDLFRQVDCIQCSFPLYNKSTCFFKCTPAQNMFKHTHTLVYCNCIQLGITNYLLLMTAFIDTHFRSSPVESLHTVLLGTCKYLLKSFMSSRNEQEKKQILARMSGFNYSGFSTKVYGNVCYYYQSFVGRDFKGWMQMSLFIISPYLTDEQKKVWLLLSKVTKLNIIHCSCCVV